MNKKSIAAVFLAVAMLSGCTVTISQDGEETTPIVQLTPPPETTSNVGVLEDLPEDTTTEATTQYEEPPLDIPDGFPVPYPVGTIDDEESLTLFKEVINNCIYTESILKGYACQIPTTDLLEDGYYQVDPEYAQTIKELEDKVGKPFASYYWADSYGLTLDQLLTEDESLGAVRVKYIDDKLGLYKIAVEDEPAIDMDTAVLTYLKGDYATVVALGTLGEEYYWKSYELINGYRGWVVEKTSIEKATGEFAVFSKLLIEDMKTLDKIFGAAEPVFDDRGMQVMEYLEVQDDIYGNGYYYGLQVEKFMSIEQMREFVRTMFTSEIAESYISLYINRTYIESDGKLYMITGSILPRLGEFDLSEYETTSIGTFDVVAYVNWGEDDMKLPITVCYEDAVWKLNTRIPMLEDTLLTQKSE